jgi:hypothetical protein
VEAKRVELSMKQGWRLHVTGIDDYVLNYTFNRPLILLVLDLGLELIRGSQEADAHSVACQNFCQAKK